MNEGPELHSSTRPRLAWVLFGMSLVFGAAAVVLTLRTPGRGEGDLGFAIGQTLLAAGYPAVGAIVAARLPRNACGWILLCIGLLQGLSNVTYAYWSFSEQAAFTLPLADAVVWVSNWVWFPSLGLLATFLLLLFPDGRLPSPRWRWFARGAAAVIVAGTAMSAYRAAQPMVDDAALDVFTVVLFVGLLVAGVGSFASLFVRYRRSAGAQRQQLKWLASGGGVAVLGILLTFAPQQSALLPIALAMLLALPAAIGLAILRYRLYDIDRIISRTVSYLLLTGLLAAVYAAGVVLLRPVVGRVTGESQVSVAISTIVVAALFGPARRWIQSQVDHRFNRARYDAVRVVEQFSTRLRDQVDAAELEADLISVVHQTVAPQQASLWLRRRPSSP